MWGTLELPSVDRTMQLFRYTRNAVSLQVRLIITFSADFLSRFQKPYAHKPGLTRARAHPTLCAAVETRYAMIPENNMVDME
jgi:hypothetical protein